MTSSDPRNPAGRASPGHAAERADRLGNALRANLARRKAQGRARAGGDGDVGLDSAGKPGDKGGATEPERR